MADVHTERHSRHFGNIEVEVVIGDITKLPADATIVPQFKSGNLGQISKTFRRDQDDPNAKSAVQEFLDYAAVNKLSYGEVIVSEARTAIAGRLMHVVSVGSGPMHVAKTIATSVDNALTRAAMHRFGTVNAPLLCTNVEDRMTHQSSAAAMLEPVADMAREYPHRKMKLVLVVYDQSLDTYKNYEAVKEVLDMAADAFDGSRRLGVGQRMMQTLRNGAAAVARWRNQS